MIGYIYNVWIIASYVWIPVRSGKSVIHVEFGWRKSRWLMQCKLMLPDFCSHLKCGDCLEYVGICWNDTFVVKINLKNTVGCISEAGAQSVAKGRRCNRSEDQGPQLTVKKKVGLNDFNVFWIFGLFWVYFDPTQKRSTSPESLWRIFFFCRQELTSPGLGV